MHSVQHIKQWTLFPRILLAGAATLTCSAAPAAGHEGFETLTRAEAKDLGIRIAEESVQWSMSTAKRGRLGQLSTRFASRWFFRGL